MKNNAYINKAMRVMLSIVIALALLAGCGNDSTASSDMQNKNSDLRSEPKPRFEPQTAQEVLILNVDVAQEKGETVFAISIGDFISSFNGYFWKEHNEAYLAPADQWVRSGNHNVPFSSGETVHYYFSESPSVGYIPTISVFATESSGNIQQIRLTFNDHGFRQSMYALYEKICGCTFRAFFPDYSDSEISKIYDLLFDCAYDNFFGDDYGEMPNEMYRKGNIGLYGYYGAGVANICILPLANKDFEELSKFGIKFYDLDDELSGDKAVSREQG